MLDLSAFPRRYGCRFVTACRRPTESSVGGVGAWFVRGLPLALPFLVASRRDYAAGRERRSFVAGFVAALARAGAMFVNPPPPAWRSTSTSSTSSAGCGRPASRCRRRWPLTTRGPLSSSQRRWADLGLQAGRRRWAVPAGLSRGPGRGAAPRPRRRAGAVPGGGAGSQPAGLRDRRAGCRRLRDRVRPGDDYRGAESAVVTVTLEDDEAEACRRAASACGMAFTGVDVKQREDGSFAVLQKMQPFADVRRHRATDRRPGGQRRARRPSRQAR